MGTLSRLYERLPVPLQHGAVSTYGAYWHWLRFGPGYKEAVHGYRRRERWTTEQWRHWQEDRLREVLTAAAARVPHYREIWAPSEHKAARAGDLRSLPVLEKDELRSDPTRFLDPAAGPRRPLIFQTSGSTGTPIASYWTARELRASVAVREVRSAGWAGVSFRLPRATFSGRMVEPDPASRGPYYRFNAVERQVYLSAFHVRPDTAGAYASALARHQVRWGTGYATSYYLLARNLRESEVRAPKLSAIVTTSEKLTPGMRAVIGDVFGCRAYEEYSSVENAVFASECEAGSLHVSPDVSIVEIIRADGSPCEPGEPGEVVTTSLDKDLQPLIRYRLGDVARWSRLPCPCGRELPLLEEVTGRIEDIVTGPDGRQLVRFHGIFVDLPGVIEGQVVQKSRDRFVVRVVASRHWQSATSQEITTRMKQRLGHETAVVVERVPAIPRARSGKFQAVISEVDAC